MRNDNCWHAPSHVHWLYSELDSNLALGAVRETYQGHLRSKNRHVEVNWYLHASAQSTLQLLGLKYSVVKQS